VEERHPCASRHMIASSASHLSRIFQTHARLCPAKCAFADESRLARTKLLSMTTLLLRSSVARGVLAAPSRRQSMMTLSPAFAVWFASLQQPIARHAQHANCLCNLEIERVSREARRSKSAVRVSLLDAAVRCENIPSPSHSFVYRQACQAP
jgi:hypothetical protein